MSKHKQPSKEKDKGVQLVIRIAKSERAAFVALCEDLDTTAAREIRRFMREFVASKSPVPALDAQAAPEDSPAPTPADPTPPPLKAAAKPSRAAKPAPATAPAEAVTAVAEATAEPTAEATSAEVAADDAEAPKKPRKRVKS
jgi:hypothetical protein